MPPRKPSTCYSNAEAVAQIGYVGDAEIVVARNGTIIAELTEIEDIVIDGQGGSDTFNTHGFLRRHQPGDVNHHPFRLGC